MKCAHNDIKIRKIQKNLDIFVSLVFQMGLNVKIRIKMRFTQTLCYMIVSVFLDLFLHVSKVEKASGGGSVRGWG